MGRDRGFIDSIPEHGTTAWTSTETSQRTRLLRWAVGGLLLLAVAGVLTWRMTAGSAQNGFSTQVTDVSASTAGTLTIDFNAVNEGHRTKTATCRASSSGFSSGVVIAHSVTPGSAVPMTVTLTGGASSSTWVMVSTADVSVSCT
jgi:hypothetical protein